ncbi:OLC1v1020581C1 [Oldenlandia corymbosa var. corymbosa]|uniref:OLC1v1020581C1 n=1 Tax=Oldenlandia corymbosa var. corymbosa TaxID=529605 RepID=A0AAV1EGU9_OLDCO|nr:OLC1v1020581C1 [Oldenlandia corymbosa var. corymbosa]
MDKVPVWIQLHGLELKYWNLNSLGNVASTIGCPIKADEHTVKKIRVQYARLLVEMELSDSVPDKIAFEDETSNVRVQKVVYEWLPSICKCYKGFGHLIENCQKKVTSVEKKVPVSVSEWRQVKKDKGGALLGDSELVLQDKADVKPAGYVTGDNGTVASVVMEGNSEFMGDVVGKKVSTDVQATQITAVRKPQFGTPEKL